MALYIFSFEKVSNQSLSRPLLFSFLPLFSFFSPFSSFCRHLNLFTSPLELDPPSSGYWDSVHVFEVNVPAPGAHTAQYKVTSTIMLGLGKGSGLKSQDGGKDGEAQGEGESLVQGDLTGEGIELVGSLQRQVSKVKWITL